MPLLFCSYFVMNPLCFLVSLSSVCFERYRARVCVCVCVKKEEWLGGWGVKGGAGGRQSGDYIYFNQLCCLGLGSGCVTTTDIE